MSTNEIPLLGTDHIEFYVGNAKQASHYYQTAFGFQPLAYAGPETGQKDRVSYVLSQGKIRLVFTTALFSDHEINRHQARHGDGVKMLALTVPDATEAWKTACARGAISSLEPMPKIKSFSVLRNVVASM